MLEKKILFIRASSLGDILQTIPCAVYLKAQCPDVILDWVVEEEFEPLLSCFPIIDHVIGVPIRKYRKGKSSFGDLCRSISQLRSGKYDLSIDFQGNSKSGLLHMLTRSGVRVGDEKPAEWLNAFTTKHRYQKRGRTIQEGYLSLLCQACGWNMPELLPTLAQPSTPKGALLVAPCSAWDSKMLPFAQLEALLTVPYEVVCGSEEEAERLKGHFKGARHVHIRPAYSAWISLTQRAAGVVCMDSAQLHLASLLGVPTFSFFGPSSQAVYAPVGRSHASYQGGCPLNVSFVKRCPHLRTCTNKGCIKQMSGFEATFKKWLTTHTHQGACQS